MTSLIIVGCSNGESEEVYESLRGEAENKSIVYFKSDRCPACQQQDPIWDELSKGDLKESFNFITIDVDDIRNNDLLDLFDIVAIPTFTVIAEDGLIIYRYEGYKSERELFNLFEDIDEIERKVR